MVLKNKLSWIIGFSGGILADGLLRILTGEEGNLLVHSVIFGFFARLFFTGSKLFLRLFKKYFKNKNFQ
ncbi:hypothetical protein NOU10_03540 [Ligilactobacillus sp. MP3]|uniref:hypothetical protein n=1 Tax=Ligilactobacillus sp. MP3 TaxID=2965103 RepID=UPI00210D4B05|nr:hypothetical protein [Ligilactobacillus sp. MP3]MCQ4116463.1 hypothetical protein [Ligilactobacillus sp. MP3]